MVQTCQEKEDATAEQMHQEIIAGSPDKLEERLSTRAALQREISARDRQIDTLRQQCNIAGNQEIIHILDRSTATIRKIQEVDRLTSNCLRKQRNKLRQDIGMLRHGKKSLSAYHKKPPIEQAEPGNWTLA
ncbi:MAG: hypothetical protein JRI89_00655 [Deltaproteobacteria bacterium]|nr:hypothetical protein [Deltaproteobacteria bacterium]